LLSLSVCLSGFLDAYKDIYLQAHAYTGSPSTEDASNLFF